MGITSKAILIGLHTAVWSNRKADRARAESLAADAGAARKSLRVAKTLIDESHFSAVQKAISKARTGIYYPNTLPWDDSSNRILPVTLLDKVRADLQNARDEFYSAVQDFMLVEWPKAMANAPHRLGELYDPADYPDTRKVEDAFRFQWEFSPIPEVGDFRIALEDQARRELSASYEQQLAQRASAATKEVWTRAYDALTHLAERVRSVSANEEHKAAGGTDSIRFHKSALENVQAVATLMTQLNVEGDAQLDEMAGKLNSLVGGLEPDTLKTQANARDDLLSGAEWLIAEMEKRV